MLSYTLKTSLLIEGAKMEIFLYIYIYTLSLSLCVKVRFKRLLVRFQKMETVDMSA